MADAKTSILKTLIHEGGYVDNPADPGGATNMGITQADMPGVDMKTITADQAISYYATHYWKPFYTEIGSQLVADKLFDLGVLFGIGEAIEKLQIVLNLTADGVFGPHSLAAVNDADPGSLLAAYKTVMVSHAIGIATAKPAERIFLQGWINRINS